MEQLNIYQRMAKITAKLPVVAKNLKVETFKGGKGYKAVSERDILDAVKPLEAEYGIYSFPYSRDILIQDTLETGSPESRKTIFMSRIKTVYRFVNIDNPQEYIETIVFSEGIDSQDKGSGKAMTYGDKYALMKAYKISTGDDPDVDPSEERKYDIISTNEFKKKISDSEFDKEFDKSVARSALIEALNVKGINVIEYSKEKGLSKETTKEQFEQLLKELKNER